MSGNCAVASPTLDTAIAELTSILVYKGGGGYAKAASLERQVSGSNDIKGHLATFPIIRSRLGEPATMTMQVVTGSPWISERILQIRDRIHLVFDDGSERIFRVRTMKANAQGTGAALVTGWELWSDLGDYLWATGWSQKYVYPVSRITVSEALDKVFAGYHAPARTNGSDLLYFRRGSVDSEFSSKVIALDLNYDSMLDGLRKVGDQLQLQHGYTFEVEPEYDAGSDLYRVHCYRETGWSTSERTAGVADPSLRPISGPSAGEGAYQLSRFELEVDDDQNDNYFTHFIPYIGPDELYRGIDEHALWCLRYSYDSASDLTEVHFYRGQWPIYESGSGDVVWMDNAWRGYYLQKIDSFQVGSGYNYGSTFEVIRSEAPYTVHVRGELHQWDGTFGGVSQGQVRFCVASDGTAATHLQHYDGSDQYGTVWRSARYEDVPPVANDLSNPPAEFTLMVADMSGTWYGPPSAPRPFGWTEYPTIGGSITTQKITDPEYVYYGDATLKVTCPVGEGFQTWPIKPRLTKDNPYYSVWAAVRVDPGTRIRMEVIDGRGNAWPTGAQKAESTSSALRGLSIGGMEPWVTPGSPIYGQGNAGSDKVRVRFTVIEAEGATGSFYIDAVSAHATHIPFEFYPGQGPDGLVFQSAEEMKRSAARLEQSYRAQALEVTNLSPAYEEIKLGSWVTLRDFYVAGTGYKVTTTGRVVALGEDTHPLEGYRKTIDVKRKEPDLADRFRPTEMRGLLETYGVTADTGSGGTQVVEEPDDVYRMSGFAEVVTGSDDTRSRPIQVGSGVPIVKGILTAHRATAYQTATDAVWAVDNEAIRFDTFRIRLGTTQAIDEEFMWGFVYPRYQFTCDWDDVDQVNLILHYDFEEQAGHVLHDLAPTQYGLNAVLGNVASDESTDPKWNTYGLLFASGSDQYTRTKENPDKFGSDYDTLPLTASDVTMLVVSNANVYGGGSDAIWAARGNYGSVRSNYFMRSSGSDFYAGYQDGTATIQRSFTPNWASDAWKMLWYVRDTNTGSNRVYMNRGLQILSWNSSSDPYTLSPEFFIGMAPGNTGSEFAGSVAYALVYDAAKTEDEIKDLFDTVYCILKRRGISIDASVPARVPAIVWEASTILNGGTYLVSPPYPPYMEFLSSTLAANYASGDLVTLWEDTSGNGINLGSNKAGTIDPPTVLGPLSSWRGRGMDEAMIYNAGSAGIPRALTAANTHLGSDRKVSIWMRVWHPNPTPRNYYGVVNYSNNVYVGGALTNELYAAATYGTTVQQFYITESTTDTYDVATQQGWSEIGLTINGSDRTWWHRRSINLGTYVAYRDYRGSSPITVSNYHPNWGSNSFWVGAAGYATNDIPYRISNILVWNGVALNGSDFVQASLYVDFKNGQTTGSDLSAERGGAVDSFQTDVGEDATYSYATYAGVTRPVFMYPDVAMSFETNVGSDASYSYATYSHAALV